MTRSPYQKIAFGEMKGWVREDLLHLLPSDFFRDPVSATKKMGEEVVSESRWRWAGFFTLSAGNRVFLKRDRTKGWQESLKYLIFPSKGRKEWFVAYQMGKRNLNIPKPLGWIERVHQGFVRESYYLSEAIDSKGSLADSPEILKDKKISTELVKMLLRIHNSGLFHQDLHAGNFLWDGGSLFLIDLHRAKLFRSLSLNQRLWNLSQLFHSLRSVWGEEEQLRFLDRYFEGDSISPQKKEEYLRKIYSWMDHLQKRQWTSRAKRCLKESTEFSVKKEDRVTFYHRRDFPLNYLKRAMEKHLAIVQQAPALLVKESPEVKVSVFDDEGNRICVKQFCYPRRWDRLRERFRHSKGLKGWLGGNGLWVRGVSSVKPLAFVEQKSWFGKIESFFIMEASADAEEMDRFLCKGFRGIEEKRAFLETFARWLAKLHQKEIYHQDLKACNVLVSRDDCGWRFKLLDLEDVRLNEKVNERKLFKNLLQLNTSIPNLIKRTDRLRFFKTYQEHQPIVRDERNFLLRLLQESRDRGVIYNSPQGVIKEVYH